MKCSRCGNDLMLAIEPRGLRKLVRILPVSSYRCVRCGHVARRLDFSAYGSTPVRVLLVVLVLAGLAAAVWLKSPDLNGPPETAAPPRAESPAAAPANETGKDNGEVREQVSDRVLASAKQEPAPNATMPEEPETEALPAPEPEDPPAAPARAPEAETEPEPAAEQAPAAPKGPPALRSVQPLVQDGKLLIGLLADRAVEESTVFTLQDPPRAVVDLPGQWTYDGPEKVKLPAKNAEALRVGLHDDKLRVVVDFAAGQKPVEPEARPVPHGLLLVLPIP